MVERLPVEHDRRATSVRLTPAGRKAFLAMAREHEAWIVSLFDGLPASERQRLYASLGRLKRSLGTKEA
jgi:DNA-binding MarR family transcriptional regulator